MPIVIVWAAGYNGNILKIRICKGAKHFIALRLFLFGGAIMGVAIEYLHKAFDLVDGEPKFVLELPFTSCCSIKKR
ncbi:hypothetical protein SAMN05216366_13519 [Selenomonas ruminantium]|uniref:Uncharacterized protein n=1 Tax=Selenomonas ruminantium TaxID=971 RepID=A0A1H0UNB2_SELRU|nr:hypothetical protein SAMN05216366_13519 [Selenomonas ruminantium]